MHLCWWLLLLAVAGSTEVPDGSKPPEETTVTTATPPSKEDLFLLGKDYLYGNATLERDIAAAVRCFKEAAALGHAGAQFKMYFLFTHGIGVPKNDALAILHLTFSALSGNTNAQLALAHRHLNGYGVAKGCGDAVRYYRQVADKVAKAFKESGVLAQIERIRLNDENAMQQRQTDEDIMHYYQYSADKGDPHAQIILGRAYMFGMRGMEQDAELAESYFNKAIETGEVAGHGGLGQLYAQGVDGGKHPLPRDYTKAHLHFKLGAEQKHPVSQNGMGFLYMMGKGVARNHSEAARYFRMAADQHNPEAQYNLGVLYLNGEGLPKDATKALKHLQAASQQGQILAHYQLGTMYSDGIGVAQPNCFHAVKYYKAVTDKGQWNRRIEDAHEAFTNGDTTTAFLHYLVVAEQGSEIGQNNAATLLDQGRGLEEIPRELLFPLDVNTTEEEYQTKNINEICKERALQLYMKSAEQNNVESLVKIGDYHYYGWGTPVDWGKSVEKYREASEHRHSQAYFNLGFMHENGLSMPKDFHLAKRYYDLAATHSEKAWVAVGLALGKLHVKQWMEEISSGTGAPWMIGQCKVEDVILAALVGLLGILMFLRHNARMAA